MAASDRLKRATRDLIEHGAELVTAHSYPPLLGKIWVALYVHDAPPTCAQLAAFLDQPATDVAAALQQLGELGLARDSAGQFSTEADPLVAVARFMRGRELPLLVETEESLRYACDELAAGAGSDEKRASERLAALARQIGLLHRLLDRLTAGGRLDLAALVKSLGNN